MPTIIDSLILQLSLDTKGFKAGQAQATSGMAAIRDGATKTGADVGKVAQGITQGFARVRTELLGLLGLFVATKSITGLTSQVTAQDAALGRLSSRLGVSTGDISAWDRAAQSAGAQAGEATGSLTGLSAAMERFKLTGQGGESFIVPFARLGVHLRNANGEMKTATEQQLELARAFQAMDRTDPKATDFYASQLPGSSQGNTDFLRRGPEFVQARLDKQRAIGLPTQRDARNAQDILEQLGYVDQRMTTFGRHLLNDVSPGITRVLSRLGDWLDRHLPGWYAKIDPIIQGFMKSLDGLNFDTIAREIRDFGTSVWDTFKALRDWQPPGWLEWMKRQVVGSPDAPKSDSADNNAGRDGIGLGGLITRSIGQGVGGQKAVDYFVAQGWTPEQASGIAGNLQQESGFKPEAGFNADGTPGSHSGIAQWDKTRREAIEANFGKKLGAMNYDEQLQAVQYELTQGLAKKAGDRLREETTAGGAAVSVAHHFEIPVGANDPDAAAKWAKEEAWRRQYAEQQFKAYPGTGKRELDHDGGFWDGFRNPHPELSAPPAPWVPPSLPEWRPVPPIPKIPEDGKNYPGDGGTEKPDLDGLKRYLARQDGQPIPSAAERWGGSTTNNTAHHDNSSTTTINGPINVQTQAKDAPGIARDIGAALKARTAAAQANRGLS